MEQRILPHNTNLSTQFDSFTDFDYIDELMLEDCWLLETNCSEFTNPISTFEPSFSLPTLEANQEESQIPQSQEKIPSESYLLDWITPRAPTSVMDRLIWALRYMKDCSRDENVLIQIWVPVKIGGGKCVLTTNGQPFSVDLNCQKLARYREISANYQFPAEEDSKEVMGLPGRVFRSKAPEWTPDVRFFTRDEYPRVNYAQQYDVRGTLAVPVLERGTRNCLGVVEVVLTTQKIKYRPELESVCKALEAVDLGSSQVSSSQNLKMCDFSYQAALPEISSVLRTACQTHGLPLAQTWVSCIVQGKQGCRHSQESSFENCFSTVDSACYVNDPGNILGFHEACSEHHLLKDQGIVGRAFGTNQPCFSHDVTSCSKTEYPLSHHARMFGLKAAVAIRLRSICTGSVDFVLEFFLPVNCTNPKEQKGILDSLSTIIRNNCWTLRVVTDKELQEKSSEVLFDSYSRESITFATHPSTSDYDTSLYAKKKGQKRRIKAEENITLQVLRQHFAGSLKDAAKNLGVCPTTLKRICRREGIESWPSRKIKKVNHSLEKIQRVIDSVQGTSGISKIESFYSTFPEMSTPQIPNPKSNDHVKPLDETGLLSPPSSSGSQSSTLSQCFSSGTQPNSHTSDENREDPPMVNEEYVKGILERATNNEMELVPSGPRIKVSFGEDKIRFRMQSTWKFEDLLKEITRRFGIEDARGFYLKYLDDDEEWVLLTCDADLEECIDVCRSSQSDIIKLSFLRDPHSKFGTSFDVIRGHLGL
ncbi:hypothetical protein ACJIZ3_003287 [Penstemon smallii]|uniref:Plant regulator RWP-RK family protein n=1 Tax=Penstemon smallii TaxID=265156 RepID=A0ABD3U8T6_9LAMI